MADQGGSSGGMPQGQARTLLFRVMLQDNSIEGRQRILDSLLAIQTGTKNLNQVMAEYSAILTTMAEKEAADAEAKEAQKNSIQNLVKEYQSATTALKLYSDAQDILASQEMAQEEAAANGITIVGQFAEGLTLATEATEKYKEQIAALPPGLKELVQALQQAKQEQADAAAASRAAANQQVDDVSKLLSSYNNATAGLDLFTKAQAEIDKQMQPLSGFTAAGKASIDALDAAYNLAGQEMQKFQGVLNNLGPGYAQLSAALKKVKEDQDAATKAQAAAASVTTDLNKQIQQYQQLTSQINLYTAVEQKLAQTQAAQYQAGTITYTAYNQMSSAIQMVTKLTTDYETELSKLPPELQVIVEALKKVKEEQAAAANPPAAAAAAAAPVDLSKQVSDYQALSSELLKYQGAVTKLTASMLELQAAGKGNTAEYKAQEEALALANAKIAELQGNISKTTPGVQDLSAAMAATKQITEDSKNSFAGYVESLLGLGRGLASSLFGFSLIAGGMVAVGHIIGQEITNAVASFERLRSEVATLAQLNPTLKTDDLVAQITGLENRLGILSENIVAVYKATAGITQGGPGTEEFVGATAQASQASRQDYLQWSQAIVQSMQAYNLTIADSAHVQDVLTVAMQNSMGQGASMLQLWGSVTKAASGMNTGLNETAAAMTVVVQHGGDIQENMRALKGAFDALITPHAIQQMQLMGVQISSTGDNSADLMSILGQLKELMAGWSPADQSEMLRKLFQDRDVVNVMRTLLNNYGELKTQTDAYASSTGAAQAAEEKFTKSGEAQADRLKATQQAIGETAGQYLDLGQHLAGLFNDLNDSGLPQFVQNLSDAFTKGVSDLSKLGSQTPTGAGVSQQDQTDQVNEQKTALEGATRARLADADAAKKEADAHTALYNSLGYTAEGYKAMVDWSGKLLDSSTSLTVNIKGLSTTFNQLLSDAKAMQQENPFYGFGSGQEQTLSTLAEQIQQTMGQITTLRGEIRTVGTIGIDPGSVWGSITGNTAGSQLDLLNEKLKTLTGEAIYLGGVVASNTPQARLAAADAGEQQRQAQATMDIAAQETAAAAVTDKWNESIRNLTNQQRDLQEALKENATPELAKAYKELTDAQDTLAAGTLRFNRELNDLRKSLLDTQDASKKVLDPLTKSVQDAERALQDFNQQTAVILNQNNTTLHELQNTQKDVATTQRELVETAQAAYDAATKYYDQLKTATELQDQVYKNNIGDLQRQLDLLKRLDAETLNNLKDNLDALKFKLQDITHEEDLALRPYQDSLAAQKDQLEADKARIQDISLKYEYLNGLQREYDALKQQELQIKQQEDLLNSRESVENLTARLTAATKGTSDYLQLQQELVKAKNQDALLNQEFSLQNQIAAGKEAQQAEMDAANARLLLDQKEYDATNRQITAIKQKYDVEKRAVQDSMDRTQREIDIDTDLFHNREVGAQNQIDDLKEEQRQYDITQQKKLDAAKADQTAAKDALDTAKIVEREANEAQASIVDVFQRGMTSIADTNKGTQLGMEQTVTDAKRKLEDETLYWKGLTGAIQDKINHEDLDAQRFGIDAGANKDAAQKNYNLIKDAIGLAIDRLGDQINTMRDTATEQETATKRIIDAERKKQQAILDTWNIMKNALDWARNPGGSIAPPTAPVTPPYDPGSTPQKPYVPPYSVPAPTAPPSRPPGIAPNSRFYTPAAPNSRTGGVGGNSISMGNIVIQVQGGNTNDEAYWYGVGDKVVRGVRKRLQDQYGTDLIFAE